MKIIFIISGCVLIISGIYFFVIGVSNYISKQVAHYIKQSKV